MSLELPDAPQSLAVPLDKGQALIERADAYFCKDDRLQVMIVHTLPAVQFNLTGFKAVAKGFVDKFTRSRGISDFQSSIEARGDVALFKGSYSQNGNVFEMRGLVCGQNRDLWIVVTEFAQADAEMRKTAGRVLDSVEIAR